MKRITAAVLILAALTAGGVAAYRYLLPRLSRTPDSSVVSVEGRDIAATEAPVGSPPPSYPAVPLKISPVIPTDAEIRIEAENAEYKGDLTVESKRKNYSGDGYLTGFSKKAGDSVKAVFEVPASQHYTITISVCADAPVTNTLLLNGKKLGDFTISETENFTRVTFSGIYLPEGEAELSISEIDGYFALDYFEITNFSEMYSLSYEEDYELSDPSASQNAKKLMSFLAKNYGKKIISAQYASGIDNIEPELICQLTGKYPAIRFGDVEGLTNNSTADGGDVIEACQRWSDAGGIVGLMWHWDAPLGVSTVYAKDADFSLKEALPEYEVVEETIAQETETETDSETEEEEETLPVNPYLPETVEQPTEEPELVERYRFKTDVAMMNRSAIEKAVKSGKISEECAALLQDIDSVAIALRPLAEKDIPVLWRPLHEAGGDWYWWGADGAEAYCWLWDVMYRRMTKFHKLHNLIWIWNGQDADYLVEDYDIASLDIYLDKNTHFGSRYEQFVALYRMTDGKKMLAMSETSSVPDVNEMFRDNTVWSFCGLWYGEYLIGENGKYSSAYTPANTMIAFYNSEAVITRDGVKLK